MGDPHGQRTGFLAQCHTVPMNGRCFPSLGLLYDNWITRQLLRGMERRSLAGIQRSALETISKPLSFPTGVEMWDYSKLDAAKVRS